MKAWALTEIGKLELVEVPQPEIAGENQVLVRVGAVGVCGSDVHYYREGGIGDQKVEYPFLIGHECAGAVEGVGLSVTRLKPGDRVAIDPAISCMRCDQCKEGRFHTCRDLLFMGCPGQAPGCLAEYIVVPERNCLPVAQSMSPGEIVMVEPLSIGIHAVRQCAVKKDAVIAILGAGPIGLSVMYAARAQGVSFVYVTDRLDYRVENALESGADWGGNVEKVDVVGAILENAPLGLDAVFECCGEQEALDQAVSLLKPGGSLSVVGIPALERTTFDVHELRRKEITVRNVRRQLECIPEAIELIEGDTVNTDGFVTHQIEFADAPKAFDLVSGYKDSVIKAIVNV